jgi:hypothetical protein
MVSTRKAGVDHGMVIGTAIVQVGSQARKAGVDHGKAVGMVVE